MKMALKASRWDRFCGDWKRNEATATAGAAHTAQCRARIATVAAYLETGQREDGARSHHKADSRTGPACNRGTGVRE